LVPADFFLFRHVKDELAGVTFDHSTLKKEWEGHKKYLHRRVCHRLLAVV
jgi:hypothetical protein